VTTSKQITVIKILISKIAGKLDAWKFQDYISLLSTTEQKRILGYRRWQDAHLSLFGKLLVMQGLILYGYKKEKILELNYTSYHRPFFVDGPEFNISHSGNYVICVISDSAKIGTDIEKISEIDLNEFNSCWTDKEFKNIMANSLPFNQFYHYWTRKEALIKADGRGMNLPLKKIDVCQGSAVVEDKEWFFYKVEIDSSYSCHVASDVKGTTIEPHYFSFD
jgi:4'-phosphopantetheinyl transferase